MNPSGREPRTSGTQTAPDMHDESSTGEELFRLLDEWESLVRLLDRDADSLDHLDALLERRDMLVLQVATSMQVLKERWPEDHPRRRWLRGELELRQARILEHEQHLALLLGQELAGLRQRLGGLDHTRRTLVGYGRRPKLSPRHVDTQR